MEMKDGGKVSKREIGYFPCLIREDHLGGICPEILLEILQKVFPTMCLL